MHALEGTPYVVATLHQGSSNPGSDGRWISTTTIEPRLEQLGQGAPIVRMHLRRYVGASSIDGDPQAHDHRCAGLDTALNYLVKTAERD